MLQKLEQLLSMGPIYLYLHDKESSQPVKAVTTADPQSPSKNHDGRRLLFPIRMSGLLLSTLEVWYQTDQGLSETDRRLLETLCDQLATAIFLKRQITEKQQISLNEERAVIALELHDSLAQSLSYLKIQMARLRRNIQGDQKIFQNAILEELSDGLNSAYRQLRELLATFRLKLDTPDLPSALRTTVEEFSQRLGMPIELNYNLPPQTLSPNEEVHTLHIVREALCKFCQTRRRHQYWCLG